MYGARLVGSWKCRTCNSPSNPSAINCTPATISTAPNTSIGPCSSITLRPRMNFSISIQNAISNPVIELIAPKLPKKCSGRDMYFSRKRIVIRSKKTRKVREIP